MACDRLRLRPRWERSGSCVLAAQRLPAAALGLLLLGAASMGGTAPAVSLVQDGAAVCEIVAAASLSPSEQTAVKELQRYVRDISGAELAVVPPDRAAAKTRLVVGNRTVRGLFPDVALDGLGPDGYVLRASGNSILIAGGEKRGTLYAAYAFLERLGVRWWAVGATHVPRMATVSVAPFDERWVPTFEYRDTLYATRYLGNDDNPQLWKVRNRLNAFAYATCPEQLGGKVEGPDNIGHSFAFLMQPVDGIDTSLEKNPDLWALHGGRRTQAQPCLSHPLTYEVMKANLLKQLREHPEYAYAVFGQNDNKAFCECPACAALAEREESNAGPVLALANRLGEAMEQEFPRMVLLSMAYEWSRKPPKTILPRANVGVTLCSIECDFARPLAERSTPANVAFADDLTRWGQIAPKLYVWDYAVNFSHYLLPHPNLDVLVPNLRFFAANGVKGIMEQGCHTSRDGEFGPLRMWLIAQAMRDPGKADGNALLGEFLDGYYGPAAAGIRKYIDAMHATGRSAPDIRAGCYSKLDAPWLAPDAIAASETALREAEHAVADDPDLLARVRHAHMPIWYVLLKRGAQSKTWAATEAKVGKLDIRAVASGFAQVIATNTTGQVAEGETIAPFVGWVAEYAERSARDGAPIPPELQGADPASYRLIQACQMDGRPRWWLPQAGASDGWAAQVPTVAWHTTLAFSPVEDVVPGQTYKLFVRVKASAARESGDAFWCGVGLKQTRRVAARDLPADDAFHAFEICEFTAGTEPMGFWMALVDSPAPPVFLDCLWLRRVAQ